MHRRSARVFVNEFFACVCCAIVGINAFGVDIVVAHGLNVVLGVAINVVHGLNVVRIDWNRLQLSWHVLLANFYCYTLICWFLSCKGIIE